MAFTRPTLSTIIDRIKGDFKSGLSLTAILRRSFLDVMAKAFGGASHTLHGHIEYGIETKFFPDNGDEETVIRWGTLYNLPRNDATFAKIIIDVVGSTGGTLPVDQIYVRSDGVEYKVDAETPIPAATTVQVTITALDEGAGGNIDIGDTLSLQSSIAGIESEAAVNSISIEGENEEPLPNYRQRVLERLRFPPSGGTVNDYVGYAKTITGVTRVWVLPGYLGEGSVGVTFVEDGEADIIPLAPKVDEVQTALINLAPVEADVFTFAPIELEINPQIQIKPNTTAVQNAVIAELEDLLAREAQVRGATTPTDVETQYDGKIKLSQINEAISIAAGEQDHVLLFPTSDVQPSEGGLVTLGTPVFTTLP